MIKIYNKVDFNDLPDYVWEYWLKRIKKEIIKTSYPLFMIRVGISDKNEETELYKTMWNINNLNNDATFYDYFYFENKYIGIAINTIFDYIETFDEFI